ncbi:MAG: hypothetical protein ACYCXF_09225, partial [Thermoleophilia bacterium]
MTPAMQGTGMEQMHETMGQALENGDVQQMRDTCQTYRNYSGPPKRDSRLRWIRQSQKGVSMSRRKFTKEFKAKVALEAIK